MAVIGLCGIRSLENGTGLSNRCGKSATNGDHGALQSKCQRQEALITALTSQNKTRAVPSLLLNVHGFKSATFIFVRMSSLFLLPLNLFLDFQRFVPISGTFCHPQPVSPVIQLACGASAGGSNCADPLGSQSLSSRADEESKGREAGKQMYF